MDTRGPLQEIVAVLALESSSESIPRQRVLEWMRTDDLESMGALYSLITDHVSRIHPALQFDEYYPFALTYFQRCLFENPQSEWAKARYDAGMDILGWFVSAWRDPEQRASTVPHLKEWLGSLYLTGDAGVRTCIVQAALEHLFENRDVADYFSDWKERPVLSIAYAEAMEWVDGGGRSPFWLL